MYTLGETEYFVPARLAEDVSAEVVRLAAEAEEDGPAVAVLRGGDDRVDLEGLGQELERTDRVVPLRGLKRASFVIALQPRLVHHHPVRLERVELFE